MVSSDSYERDNESSGFKNDAEFRDLRSDCLLLKDQTMVATYGAVSWDTNSSSVFLSDEYIECIL
jgi:hypothetical protein